MARMSKEAKFEMRTQNRKDAVKHMRDQVSKLKSELKITKDDRQYDVINDRITFLLSVIDKTNLNLNPKRHKPARSIADAVPEAEADNVHLYDNDRSSLAGASKLFGGLG